MAALLYSEVNILTVIVLVIIALKTDIFEFDKSGKKKLFVVSVWFAAAANVFDFLWNMIITKSIKVPVFAAYGVNFMYFLCFGFSAYFFFLYAEAARKNDIRNKRELLGLSAVPLAALVFLLICSMKTGWLFYIDRDMTYHRGPLYYAQHILSYGYIVYAALEALFVAMKKESFIYREEYLSIASFVVPTLIFGVFQMFLQNLPIISVGVVISFLLVYIDSMRSLISLDPLTGISNRREFLLQLGSKTESLKQGEKLYFLFMDIDGFKQINDTYGHNEGDHVLELVALALREICHETGDLCARYGGDEFAVVKTAEENENIASFCCKICKKVEEENEKSGAAYYLQLSIGCAEYVPGESIQDLILRADSDMYADKEKNRRRGILKIKK